MRDVWIMAYTRGVAPIAPVMKVCPSPSEQPGDYVDSAGNYLGTWFKIEQVPDDVPNSRVVALLFDAKPGTAHHTMTYAALTMAAVMGCSCCMR